MKTFFIYITSWAMLFAFFVPLQQQTLKPRMMKIDESFKRNLCVTYYTIEHLRISESHVQSRSWPLVIL